MTDLVSTYELLEQYRIDLDSGRWQLSRNIKHVIKSSVEKIHGAKLGAGSISVAHVPYQMIRNNNSHVPVHLAILNINYHGLVFTTSVNTQYNGKIKDWEIKCEHMRRLGFSRRNVREIATRHSIKLKDKLNHQLRQAGKLPQPVYYQLVKNESC